MSVGRRENPKCQILLSRECLLFAAIVAAIPHCFSSHEEAGWRQHLSSDCLHTMAIQWWFPPSSEPFAHTVLGDPKSHGSTWSLNDC